MTVRHEHRNICREGSVDKGERGLGITRLHKIINKQILLLEVFILSFPGLENIYDFGQK